MSSVGSRSSRAGEKHGSVLIIHGNQRIAKFLDGVLRNAFRVKISTNMGEAHKYLREDPPDAIVCDGECFGEDSGELLDLLEDKNGFPETALILLLKERCEDFVHTRELLSNAADFVSLSIAPTLLKWKVMNVISLMREIRHLRTSALEERKRAERFESLAHMAAHDLKSPVIAMNGLLRKLKSRLEETCLSRDTEQILENMLSSCQFAETFLSDMNDLVASDKISTKRNSIRLDAIASEVIEQHRALNENNEIDIQLHAAKNLPTAMGNENRIKQVFDNLLTNALRHMGNVPNPTISITIAERGNLLVTRVSDTGVGIPAEYRATIFDPFRRGPGAARGNGSGLGLSIVKHIIDRHNGEIWVETEPGHGTTFVFTLPKSSEV